MAKAEEAIAHIEREKGEGGLYTRNYRFQVANVVANAGDFAKAAEMHQAALEARIALFGETNIDTLDSYFVVALCKYRIGEYAVSRLVHAGPLEVGHS